MVMRLMMVGMVMMIVMMIMMMVMIKMMMRMMMPTLPRHPEALRPLVQTAVQATELVSTRVNDLKLC